MGWGREIFGSNNSISEKKRVENSKTGQTGSRFPARPPGFIGLKRPNVHTVYMLESDRTDHQFAAKPVDPVRFLKHYC